MPLSKPRLSFCSAGYEKHHLPSACIALPPPLSWIDRSSVGPGQNPGRGSNSQNLAATKTLLSQNISFFFSLFKAQGKNLLKSNFDAAHASLKHLGCTQSAERSATNGTVNVQHTEGKHEILFCGIITMLVDLIWLLLSDFLLHDSPAVDLSDCLCAYSQRSLMNSQEKRSALWYFRRTTAASRGARLSHVFPSEGLLPTSRQRFKRLQLLSVAWS